MFEGRDCASFDLSGVELDAADLEALESNTDGSSHADNVSPRVRSNSAASSPSKKSVLNIKSLFKKKK